MSGVQIIELNPDNIGDYGVCGYKDAKKHIELQKKIDWFAEYYPKGLRISIVVTKEGGYQGMLEYIPGEYAHRPVDAQGYMFIHCIFVGFKKEYKGKGYATLLLEACIKEANEKQMLGVAVVTRKGSFMVNSDFFLKKHFQLADTAKPDFNLMVLKFDQTSKDPSFKRNMTENAKKYPNGVTILRSAQCPYTEKNVHAILESANALGIKTTLIDLKDANAAQNSPCAFGTFCILHNGKIISHHPISNTRFINIIKKELATLGARKDTQ